MTEQQTSKEQRSELSKVEKSLQSFNATEAGIAELTEKYSGMIYRCEEPKQLKLAKEARAEIKKPRVNVEKIRKAAKAPLLDLGKSIDATARSLTERLRKLEDPIDEQIKKFESKEANRLANIQARMSDIGKLVDQANESQISSAQIELYLNALLELDINKEIFNEFETEALEKQSAAIGQIRNRLELAKRREADAAELEELRREKQKREDEERAKAIAAASEEQVEEPTVADDAFDDLPPQFDEPPVKMRTDTLLGAKLRPFEKTVPLSGDDFDDFDGCEVVDEETEAAIDDAVANVAMTYPGLQEITRLITREFGVDNATAEKWIERAASDVAPF